MIRSWMMIKKLAFKAQLVELALRVVIPQVFYDFQRDSSHLQDPLVPISS